MTSGAVLLDKSPGITSFGALGPLKRAFDTRRIGHTGTLDPFASGLLIALVGKMTRLADIVTGYDKEYLATFFFGAETDTLDIEGSVVRTAELPAVDDIVRTIPRFTGAIEQRPPIFSAVHVGGVRAHRLARQGQKVDVPPRQVEVHEIEMLEWAPPHLKLRISCGSGTYVRSLARDIGEASGSRAHVSELRRSRIGPYRVEDAVSADAAARGEGLMAPLAFLRRGGSIPEVAVTETGAGRVKHGAPLQSSWLLEPPPEEGVFALVHEEELLALCRSGEGGRRYIAVL